MDILGIEHNIRADVFETLILIISEYSKHYEEKRKTAEVTAKAKANMR